MAAEDSSAWDSHLLVNLTEDQELGLLESHKPMQKGERSGDLSPALLPTSLIRNLAVAE